MVFARTSKFIENFKSLNDDDDSDDDNNDSQIDNRLNLDNDKFINIDKLKDETEKPKIIKHETNNKKNTKELKKNKKDDSKLDNDDDDEFNDDDKLNDDDDELGDDELDDEKNSENIEAFMGSKCIDKNNAKLILLSILISCVGYLFISNKNLYKFIDTYTPKLYNMRELVSTVLFACVIFIILSII